MQRLHDIFMAIVYLCAATIVVVVMFYTMTIAVPIAMVAFGIYVITEFMKADRGE